MFLLSADLSKSLFSKISFRKTIRVANSLNPDQARRFVGPDLYPNCFQVLSTDDTSRQRVNTYTQLDVYLWLKLSYTSIFLKRTAKALTRMFFVATQALLTYAISIRITRRFSH